jgi:hypothetical protein
MSAKIILKGAEAGASPKFLDLLSPAPEISAFDEDCGTWDSEPYTSGGQKYEYCKGKHFLCGDDQDNAFHSCLAAIGEDYDRLRAAAWNRVMLPPTQIAWACAPFAHSATLPCFVFGL